MANSMRTSVRSALVVASLCLVASGVARAQGDEKRPLPDIPVPSTQPPPPAAETMIFHRKVFWSLVAVDAASAVADAQTSWDNLQQNPNLHENLSWLLGRRPGLARYYLTFAAIDGASGFISFRLLHSQRKTLRIAGWGLLGGMIALHTDGWIHNIRQPFLAPPPGT
jgi:hypothetical protein